MGGVPRSLQRDTSNLKYPWSDPCIYLRAASDGFSSTFALVTAIAGAISGWPSANVISEQPGKNARDQDRPSANR